VTPPVTPANPSWLIMDTDVLIQVLLTKSTGLLRKLKNEYSVQPLIVEAVEAEMFRHTRRRFSNIKALYDKTLNSGTIRVLTEELLRHENGSAIGSSLFRQAERLGQDLHNAIDRGEAFSHAAAITLGVPVMTHDRNAINKLGGNGVKFSEPLLRIYDLIAFGVQTGALTYDDCDGVRDALLDNNEWVMQCFRNCKYSSGLPLFFPRLVDGALPFIGSKDPIHSLDARLAIYHI
jgi:hypothetical protein